MNKFDALCDYMRSLKEQYNTKIYAPRSESEDNYIILRAKVQMIDAILQEAAFLNKQNKEEWISPDDEDGC